MKTKEELITEHFSLFEQGLEAYYMNNVGEYDDKQAEYVTLKASIQAKMYELAILIDNYDEPFTHE